MQREMDESSWPFEDTQWMDSYWRPDPLELYKKKREAVVGGHEGAFKHEDWTHG